MAASASAPRPSASRHSERVLLDRPEVDGIATLLLPDTIQHRQRFVVARRSVQVASHRQRAILREHRGDETRRERNGETEDVQRV